MKKTIYFLLIFLAFASFAFAQTATPTATPTNTPVEALISGSITHGKNTGWLCVKGYNNIDLAANHLIFTQGGWIISTSPYAWSGTFANGTIYIISTWDAALGCSGYEFPGTCADLSGVYGVSQPTPDPIVVAGDPQTNIDFTISQNNTCTPTSTATGVPTNTPTGTPTSTHTTIPTSTPTDTPTDTPTVTNTPTSTPTRTPTNTHTTIPTSTLTDTPTDTPTSIPTNTPTGTPTRTPTRTPSATPTSTPSTPTLTPTNTPTRTPTDTPTPSPTRTPTTTPTRTPTRTPIPTTTPTDTATPNVNMLLSDIRNGTIQNYTAYVTCESVIFMDIDSYLHEVYFSGNFQVNFYDAHDVRNWFETGPVGGGYKHPHHALFFDGQMSITWNDSSHDCSDGNYVIIYTDKNYWIDKITPTPIATQPPD